MDSIEDKIREMRGAISLVQTKKARAAVELDTAKSRLADARRVLLDDYGVATSDDARTLLEKLRRELAEAVVKIETELAEAGA